MLTPTQQQALATHNNIFVEAGAGSGKTTVLVERFLKILTETPTTELPQIIAFTFTKKAARELLDRIQEKAKEKPLPSHITKTLYLARISTIHTFASQLLRDYPFETNLDPNFRILDPIEAKTLQTQAIKTTLQTLANTHNPHFKHYLHTYSLRQLTFHLETLFKTPRITSPQDPDETTLAILTLFDATKTTYKALKTQSATLDYDDIIQEAVTLLAKNPVVQADVQTNCRFLMVDEFQDTDPLQWQLIQRLTTSQNPSRPNSNLFLVGDTKQSIYAFRGTDPTLFYKAMSDFQNVIRLSDNFRSQKNLIYWINPIFETLFTPYTPATPVRDPLVSTPTVHILSTTDKPTEHTHIAEWIQTLRKTHPTLQFHDIAILLRSKTQMNSLQKALTAHNLPSVIFSTTNYYQQEDIIRLATLAQALLNPADNLAWKRTLQDPFFFNLSESDIYGLYQHAAPTLLEKLIQSQHPLAQQLQHWLAITPLYPLHTLLSLILTETNTWEKLHESSLTNTKHLLTKLRTLDEDPTLTPRQILTILQHAIETGSNEDTHSAAFPENNIAILTIHAAKGLEFPVVILAECGKKFNFSTSTPTLLKPLTNDTEENIIEEEKRIFYVACTRARDHLHLTGHHSKKKHPPQCFLDFLHPPQESQ